MSHTSRSGRFALATALLVAACRWTTSDPPGLRAYRGDLGGTPSSLASNTTDGAASIARGTAEPVAAAADAQPTAATAEALSPLNQREPFVQLPVHGFRNAIVALPVDTTRPRPVLIALHGNFDRPEWQCGTWRDIAHGLPFILCPRGIPRRDVPTQWDRWEYASVDQTDRELQAGLAALHERFGAYVAPGPILFTGFSLGAILGVGILKRHPGDFGPVVFSEGGNENWTVATVHKIAPPEADTGTTLQLRVLYACGQADCVAKSKVTSKVIERANGQAHVVSGGNVGHMYDGPVAEAVKREWSWLIQEDPRWHTNDE